MTRGPLRRGPLEIGSRNRPLLAGVVVLNAVALILEGRPVRTRHHLPAGLLALPFRLRLVEGVDRSIDIHVVRTHRLNSTGLRPRPVHHELYAGHRVTPVLGHRDTVRIVERAPWKLARVEQIRALQQVPRALPDVRRAPDIAGRRSQIDEDVARERAVLEVELEPRRATSAGSLSEHVIRGERGEVGEGQACRDVEVGAATGEGVVREAQSYAPRTARSHLDRIG